MLGGPRQVIEKTEWLGKIKVLRKEQAQVHQIEEKEMRGRREALHRAARRLAITS